jgi:molecular chaperone GrpE
VLADFQAWLADAAVAPAGPADGVGGPAGPAVDLHTLLGQFLALRHEVNLQTRAVRGQQEHNAETLRQLTQALEALRQGLGLTQRRQQREEDEILRPPLNTLVEVHDALALAGREVRRGEESLTPLLDQAAAALEAAPEPEAPAPPNPPSLWGRLFGTGGPAEPPGQAAARREREEAAERAREARQGLDRVRQALGALVTGYTMSLQRVERALARHGLEPVPAVGRPFDPERMEVVEAVTGSGRPPGEVLEEVRRGYLYNGRVFRYAQVRVAKG